MEQTKEFIQQYHKEQLNEERLPQRIEGDFELLACIHITETHASFLIQKNESGEKYLLKRGGNKARSSLNIEREQQARIRSLAGNSEDEAVYWEEGDEEYLLRRYIEGQNLEEYLERNPVLETAEIIDIATQICDILMELHNLKPPMIHRDIKPQNLIIDRYGKIHLIDFETSRNFDRKKRKDTQFYGTEETAAPEQYGYAQTDARTDIYAFGKVLCYLLTGEYQIEACRQRGGRFETIVRKCCAFDPKKRYQTMEEVNRMLALERKRNESGRKKKILRVLRNAVVLTIVFLASIFLGNRWIKEPVSDNAQKEVQKQISQQEDTQQGIQGDNADSDGMQGETQDLEGEELLYRAAAASLKKETVTEEDLQDVVRIAVIGTTVYDISQNFNWEDMIHNDEDYVNNWDCGSISDISLLARMTNLSEVYLYNQQITNIEALEGLPIRKLYLSNNKIEDFQVLEKLPLLSELSITRNPIRVLPDFSKCPKLTSLMMSENIYANLDCLRDSSVERFAIRNVTVIDGDYTFLEEMPKLMDLDVWGSDMELMEEVSRLNGLTELGVWDYRRENLDFLAPMKNIVQLDIYARYDIDLSPLDKMENLSELSISCMLLDDISFVSRMKNLRILYIVETNVTDLSMLSECDLLSEVYVNEKQAAYIETHDPGHRYNIYEIK